MQDSELLLSITRELIAKGQPRHRWYHKLMFWRKAPPNPLSFQLSGYAIQQLLEAERQGIKHDPEV